ncbi:D-2-hydroxyglutarate dehydrogenase YdiJ [Limimaricola pyoseonensis]|uniref:D-2-hydroxyglutarate dehydrogenase n=1 Tax=Limimaricola pyoseonensis TaxID=521013 RepID=A0A1G7G6E3_9RHOB|nr:FAD-binding and (Fe-S)-binding domain-containing protein [Limimaricola pyoseonensis]SDE83673.1 FAD/FMN-containing dehydrogenase [Limimaricola pyoseonensis]
MIPRLSTDAAVLPLYAEFCAELRARGFSGELSQTAADRTVLATDNSIYEIRPQAIAFPRGTDDLVRIARLLAEPAFSEVHVAARGGGTGTNGQSLGAGLVVDLSRHMTRILEIDVAARRVRVQAGVVKDQLNAALAPHGLFFAPELSTSNRATIGGMISTDACGQGSCLYGKTRDHVLGLTTVLADGAVLHSAPLEAEALEAAKGAPGSAGRLHREIDALQRETAGLVAERFPKLNRCLTGYDLAHLRDGQGRFDLNAVLCGSEGTLGFIAEATLNLMPLPGHAALVNLRYDSFDAALRDARRLMALGPASIETIDEKVLGLAREDIVWAEIAEHFPDDGHGPFAGVNIVEFVGQSRAEIDAALARFSRDLAPAPGRRGHTVAREPEAIARIWNMRKKAVGLLGATPGEKRPIAFVEDTAVPPEALADYIAEFRAILDRRGLDYGMFGHVDAGVLHVRPALDMKAPGAEALIRDITEEVAALTQRHGGLLWGEHGKGVRSEFSPQVFGPLYPAIRRVKAAFDPRNQFNPGKIAAPEGAALLTVDGVATKGQGDRRIPETTRAYAGNALHCNGNGSCFDWDPDEAMCPSWKATRERRHSPKGRAQLMRDWLRRLSEQGIDPRAEAARLRAGGALRRFPARLLATLTRRREDASHALHEAMSGCLACKSCTGKCPVKVDVPGFRARFLELYHGRYLRPPRHHLVGRLETLLPLMARMPRLANLAAAAPLTRLVGLVATPRLSGVDLGRELSRRGVRTATPEALERIPAQSRGAHVVIVPDAFTMFYDTAVLLDALDLLLGLGVQPWIAPYLPNGKPLHVHGFLGAFEKVARRGARVLGALEKTGVALVGLDPSMTLTYRSEYRAALPEGAAPEVQLLQDWLARRLDGRPPRDVAGARQTYYLLPHCTERAIGPEGIAAWRRLFAQAGLELEVLRAGCCGMAGTFGHETEHREMSERIYAMSWAGHVAAPDRAGRLLADGYSCRAQARLIDDAPLRHPLQVLKSVLAPPPGM